MGVGEIALDLGQDGGDGHRAAYGGQGTGDAFGGAGGTAGTADVGESVCAAVCGMQAVGAGCGAGAAGNAAGGVIHDLRGGRQSLGVMAPETVQGAAGEKDNGADAGAVEGGGALDIEDDAFHGASYCRRARA